MDSLDRTILRNQREIAHELGRIADALDKLAKIKALECSVKRNRNTANNAKEDTNND